MVKAIKTYTMIAGINGCGKSSLTGVLKNQRTDLGILIDVDKLVAINGGNSVLVRHIANRVRKGGHSIPSEDVIRRFAKHLPKFFPIAMKQHFLTMKMGF
jgi:predicted ABC-type ATPase